MNNAEHIVNLNLKPSERWCFLEDYIEEMNELLSCYLNDFSGEEELLLGLDMFKSQIISTEYLEEINYIASISKFGEDQVLMANLYYDALKFYFGCTAFASESADGVLHARNLDWHTDNNLLSEHSRIFHFVRDGKTVFKSVGWFGFIGVLSGVKRGKFSVTLNAVLSPDSPEIAVPISFFLRDVLTTAKSYDYAKEQLENTLIASDCLLLLSGMNKRQLAVIERTPRRFATRYPEEESIVVTNDYKKLENEGLHEGVLQLTSCGRFDRATELLNRCMPSRPDECFDILRDKKVMMGITVQQMVFNNRTGEIQLIKT